MMSSGGTNLDIPPVAPSRPSPPSRTSPPKAGPGQKPQPSVADTVIVPQPVPKVRGNPAEVRKAVVPNELKINKLKIKVNSEIIQHFSHLKLPLMSKSV